jgi:hypothetical protein
MLAAVICPRIDAVIGTRGCGGRARARLLVTAMKSVQAF